MKSVFLMITLNIDFDKELLGVFSLFLTSVLVKFPL